MENKNIKIVVSGDICVNWLQSITYPQSNTGLNWQTQLNMHSTLKPGQALLLSKLVSLATGASVLSPQMQDIELILHGDVLSSTAELELFPIFDDKNNNEKVYRIKRFMGFTGPVSGVPRLLPIINDDPNADIIILDDENNGFNSNEEFWPLALKSSETSPIILYKMVNPIDSSALWKHLRFSRKLSPSYSTFWS